MTNEIKIIMAKFDVCACVVVLWRIASSMRTKTNVSRMKLNAYTVPLDQTGLNTVYFKNLHNGVKILSDLTSV